MAQRAYELNGEKCFVADFTTINSKQMLRVFRLTCGPVGGLFCGDPICVYEHDEFYKRAKRREDLDHQVS